MTEDTTKRYYSLRKAQELTGLPASTLRYWESQFPQLNPRKDGHGNRYYTQQDIELIQRIRYIRDEMKITRIEAIQKELGSNRKQTDEKQRATEILVQLRKELSELRKLLN